MSAGTTKDHQQVSIVLIRPCWPGSLLKVRTVAARPAAGWRWRGPVCPAVPDPLAWCPLAVYLCHPHHLHSQPIALAVPAVLGHAAAVPPCCAAAGARRRRRGGHRVRDLRALAVCASAQRRRGRRCMWPWCRGCVCSRAAAGQRAWESAGLTTGSAAAFCNCWSMRVVPATAASSCA